MISLMVGGHFVEVYFDDVAYTYDPDPVLTPTPTPSNAVVPLGGVLKNPEKGGLVSQDRMLGPKKYAINCIHWPMNEISCTIVV
jgi:hypothetical protein